MEIIKPKVKLIDEDGNVFAIMGACKNAMRKAGCSKEHIDKYLKESTSGDYDNALRVAQEYCEVE